MKTKKTKTQNKKSQVQTDNTSEEKKDTFGIVLLITVFGFLILAIRNVIIYGLEQAYFELMISISIYFYYRFRKRNQ